MWNQHIFLLFVLVLGVCGNKPHPEEPQEEEMVVEKEAFSCPAWEPSFDNLIPLPKSIELAENEVFELKNDTKIFVHPPNAEMIRVGNYVADFLRPSTALALEVVPLFPAEVVCGEEGSPSTCIFLSAKEEPSQEDLTEEAHQLVITPTMLKVSSDAPVGIFRGVQTLRQVFSPCLSASTPQDTPFTSACGKIVDEPRYGYRGGHLDVARHFFTMDQVKRHMDNLALYKTNFIHLHLTDDQGWRIEINGWPNLTEYGSGTEVQIVGKSSGECDGCFYTQQQYTELVEYAESLYMVLVPELEMPGHSNAALASYAALNCDDICPDRRTDISVGYSSLCTTIPLKSNVTSFVEDVVGQIAALTPGPFVHIGGDESLATNEDEYQNFIDFVQEVVLVNQKRMMGWEEIGNAPDLAPSSVIQLWSKDTDLRPGLRKGASVLMSPCANTYLDQTYAYPPDTPEGLGLVWCGPDSVQDTYEWDPIDYLPDGERYVSQVLGIENCLWTETIVTDQDIDQMVWPRAIAVAENAWSVVPLKRYTHGSSSPEPEEGFRTYTDFEQRLGAHGPRMTSLGIDFYPTPDIPWE